MPNESPQKGRRRVGPYELIEKVGQGGMSSVYKACDTRSGATVAVKVAAHAVVSDPQLSRRFELEYALAHPLDHPNLVRVCENGTHVQIPYLVMEFIDGVSLAQHLKAHKRLGEHDALAILVPIAEALIYLHQRHIIHRDVKPANILIAKTGEVKLADLGLVKDLGSMSQLTRSNIGLGTTHFAAPEQFDNARAADVRSDIYSLAATLYLALTGDYPFGSGSVIAVLQRKMQDQFEAPIGKCPQLRPCVDAAIRLGLQAEPERRPATMEEFTALLTGVKEMNPQQKLPGIVVEAKPKAAKKSGPERRAGVRYAVKLAAKCRPVANPSSQRWNLTVTDISLNGLCLFVSRRFEAGSALEITLPLRDTDDTVNQLARVRWVKQADGKNWMLGCEFAKELSEDELNAICVDEMSRTKIT